MNEVKFTEKDFKELRKFQNKMNLVFGESAYVGTDYATVLLEYSPLLKSMLRPLPEKNNYDFVVKFLNCSGCKKTHLFLCLLEETEYVCSDCYNKPKKKA